MSLNSAEPDHGCLEQACPCMPSNVTEATCRFYVCVLRYRMRLSLAQAGIAAMLLKVGAFVEA